MIVQAEIEQQLQTCFNPAHLEVLNESHQHSVPENSETHFRVVLVAERFAGSSRVARHQAVYAALRTQLDGPVHALALHTYTPDEWHARSAPAPDSPACLGGSKADAS